MPAAKWTRRDQAFDASNRAPPPPAAQYVSHIVKRGETLTGLALKYRHVTGRVASAQSVDE
jgi:hypothetical protein